MNEANISPQEAAVLYHELEESYFGESPAENDEIKAFLGILGDTRCFADVGAALGQYSYNVNRNIQAGTIYCIEADPFRFKRLSELCKNWQRESSNKIIPIHAAAYDVPGTIRFYRANANISGGISLDRSRKSLAQEYQWQQVDVPAVTLDSLFEEHPPEMIKVDVEGAEYRVLLGAKSLIRQRRTRFFVEVHPWGDRSMKKRPSDVFKFFLENGYDFRRIQKRWLFYPASRPARLWIKHFVVSTCFDLVLESDTIRGLAKKLMAT